MKMTVLTMLQIALVIMSYIIFRMAEKSRKKQEADLESYIKNLEQQRTKRLEEDKQKCLDELNEYFNGRAKIFLDLLRADLCDKCREKPVFKQQYEQVKTAFH